MIKKNSNFINLIFHGEKTIMNQFPLDLQLIILEYAINFNQSETFLIINILKKFPQLKENKYIDWFWISEYQKLSEDFIREFKDKVNWYWISEKQKLSEDFIREFKETFEQARNCFHKEA